MRLAWRVPFELGVERDLGQGTVGGTGDGEPDDDTGGRGGRCATRGDLDGITGGDRTGSHGAHDATASDVHQLPGRGIVCGDTEGAVTCGRRCDCEIA